MMIQHLYNDGGRLAAGYMNSRVGDCVCRAIAIASGVPYQEVHARLSHENLTQRVTKKGGQRTWTADRGIMTNRKWFKDYMKELGFTWVATMGIGTGCRVHLRTVELPAGRLVVSVSKHVCAVIDGILQDTYDCSREGRRCVYGYWIK